jgi:hypothetical protein
MLWSLLAPALPAARRSHPTAAAAGGD